MQRRRPGFGLSFPLRYIPYYSIERATTLLPFSKDAAWGADRGIMFAQIYLRLGDPDRAIEQLKQLLAVPSPISPLSLQADPNWTSLRGDPRFQQLARAQ